MANEVTIDSVAALNTRCVGQKLGEGVESLVLFRTGSSISNSSISNSSINSCCSKKYYNVRLVCSLCDWLPDWFALSSCSLNSRLDLKDFVQLTMPINSLSSFSCILSALFFRSPAMAANNIFTACDSSADRVPFVTKLVRKLETERDTC